MRSDGDPHRIRQGTLEYFSELIPEEAQNEFFRAIKELVKGYEDSLLETARATNNNRDAVEIINRIKEKKDE